MDASQAGEGKLDVTISCNGAEVRSEIKPIGRAKYEVTFIPREVAPHFIDVQFNDTQVDGAYRSELKHVPANKHPATARLNCANNAPFPGAPFRCDVIDGSRAIATGDGLSKALVGDTAWFEIDPNSPPLVEPEVVISGPNGGRVPFQMRKTSRGTFKVEYIPTEVGAHVISAKYAEATVGGSPFTCNVFDPRKIRMGDLPDGYVNKDYSFTVDATSAGRAELEVGIETNNRPVRVTR